MKSTGKSSTKPTSDLYQTLVEKFSFTGQNLIVSDTMTELSLIKGAILALEMIQLIKMSIS